MILRRRSESLTFAANFLVVVTVATACSGCNDGDSRHDGSNRGQASRPASSRPIGTIGTPKDAGHPHLVRTLFFGGSGVDQIRDVAVDPGGYIFVTGRTSSTNLPTTPNVVQPDHGGGRFDAFVAKIAPDLSHALWCTYIGGSGHDVGYGVGLDVTGRVFIAGRTSSPDLPTTAKVVQLRYGGGRRRPPYFGGDAYVVCLAPDGSQIEWATYLGGKDDDWARDLAVSSTGTVTLTGCTASTDFPVSSRAADTESNSPSIDAFCARLDGDGRRLTFSKRLAGDDEDRGQAVVVDAAGSTYVAGFTQSDDFPVVGGDVFQPRHAGKQDMFVVGFDPAGAIRFSTFLGGSDDDGAEQAAMRLGPGASLWISGWTRSSDFPVTPATFGRPAFKVDDNASASNRARESDIDNLVCEISPDGRRLVTAHAFGATTGWETAFGSQAVDDRGRIWVVGVTTGADFRMTDNAVPSEPRGQDVFVLAFDPKSTHVHYATRIGGRRNEVARGVVALARRDAIVVVGDTASPDFPTYDGSPAPTFSTDGMAFLTRIDLTKPK